MMREWFICTGYVTAFALVIVRPVVSQHIKDAITSYALAWLVLALAVLLRK